MDYYKNMDLFGDDCVDPGTNRISGTRYSVKTDIPTEIVDLTFFKNHARIDFDTDDTLCNSYIKAARQYLEKFTQLSFGVKTMVLKAVRIPDNYKLMFGPVDTITSTGFANFGDNVVEGGEDVEIEYTTLGIPDETIRIAICRYALGLYVFRENVIETKFDPKTEMDQAQLMLGPYMNKTIF